MMKKIRKAAALLMAAVLAASVPVLPLETKAEESVITIRTAEEWLDLARLCISETYSEGKTVVLEADLDLSGRQFVPIPVFCGTFEGNNHTISGISIRQPGSGLGLFRYLEEEAIIQNLNVGGELKPEGSRKRIGGIAGANRGTIRNCTFFGTGEALENLGGIAGINEETGVIENCRNQAELTGNRRVGGIAGENLGTIRDSVNEGGINAASEGLEESSDSKNSISVDKESFMTTIVVERVNDVGGIAGLSSGTIRQCDNSGAIGYDHTGYNIGGIAGRQSGLMVLCENTGEVKGRKDVGGIAGQMEPFLMIQYNKDTLDQVGDQIDQISDTTDAMTDSIHTTTDASIGNLDRVDEIVKSIRDITRGKKDERRAKRDDYDEKAKKQLDLIDETLAEMELDMGSRAADQAGSRVQGNVQRARELLAQLSGGAGGGDVLPDDYIPDEDAGVLGELEYLYGVMKELQDCAGNIVDDTEILVEKRVEGVVDGVRDFENDLDSLRVASKEFLDLTRDYKDQLVDDVDDLDGDLTGQLDQLYDELDVLSENLKSGKDQLRTEKKQLDDQLEGMHDILSEGMDRVQSERNRVEDDEPLFEDVSEAATDLSNGMIVGCANQGNIRSDFQAGGIVGTIGIELDLDPEADIETYGEESLYMSRYAQAAVRGCRNDGDILVQQDCAGGIAGAARIGVLAANQNYGDIRAEDGKYAGGIAGSSQSLILDSYTMCEVSGNDYTGGIAGLGKNLRENCAMVNVVTASGEWRGSIAGDRDEEGVASGNLYVDDGLGAVDGVTFRGEAEGISYEELLQREGIPEEFESLTVTFLADGQAVEQIVCRYGEALAEENMPQAPKKEGFFEQWETVDLSDIRKNYKVHAVYQPWTTTIADSDDPKPFLLAEGVFHSEARLLVQELEGNVFRYEIADTGDSGASASVTLHVLAGDADRVAFVKDGVTERAAGQRDGEYLIFEAGTSGEFVLVRKTPVWQIFLAAVTVCLVLALVMGKRRDTDGRRRTAEAGKGRETGD